MDEARVQELMGQMVGYMTGGAMCFGVWLGDELGLYRVLTETGPATADEVAEKAGCNARLTREWPAKPTSRSPTRCIARWSRASSSLARGFPPRWSSHPGSA